jgi:hypothetical protein
LLALQVSLFLWHRRKESQQHRVQEFSLQRLSLREPSLRASLAQQVLLLVEISQEIF